MAVPIIISVAFFATVFGVVYVAVSASNKEKLALIDKGLDAGILHYKKTNPTHGRYNALKFGILLIGLAIGLLLGNLLESYSGLEDVVAYFSMILLFGGIALVVYYLLMKKLRPESGE